MKNIGIIIILIAFPNLLLSQNTYYIGEKTYPCTNSFIMKKQSNYGGYDLSVLLAKENESGLLALTISAYDNDIRLIGNILVYLDDGSIITCVDRDLFDIVDRKATTIYKLTSDEIRRLKNSNIRSIRYKVKQDDFSANNEKYSSLLGINGYSTTERVDVPKLVIELFGTIDERLKSSVKSNCDVKTTNSNGVTIKYLTPVMVGKGKGYEVGLSVTCKNGIYSLGTTVLYESNPSKSIGELLIELDSGYSLRLTLAKSTIANVKEYIVSLNVYSLTANDIYKLQNGNIKKIVFQEANGTRQIVLLDKNVGVVKRHLNCLK